MNHVPQWVTPHKWCTDEFCIFLAIYCLYAVCFVSSCSLEIIWKRVLWCYVFVFKNSSRSRSSTTTWPSPSIAKYVKTSQTIFHLIFISSKQEHINTPVILIRGCVPPCDWLMPDDSFQQAGVGLARRRGGWAGRWWWWWWWKRGEQEVGVKLSPTHPYACVRCCCESMLSLSLTHTHNINTCKGT